MFALLPTPVDARAHGHLGDSGSGGVVLACLLVPPPAPPPWITLIRHSLPRPISSSHTLLLLPHPFSLLKLIQYHSGALHLVALKLACLGDP